MSTPQNFRSALNGFNREDVVNYISFLSNKHENQLNALRTENEELRGAVSDQEQTLKETARRLEEVEQQLASRETVEQELEEKRTELELVQEELGVKDSLLREMEKTVAELKAQLAKPQPEPQKQETAVHWSEELNAYRRAESAERRARERVNQMYDRANGALADASVRVEQTAGEIATLAAKVEADLSLLHQAIAGSEQLLADTAVALGAIRPETD